MKYLINESNLINLNRKINRSIQNVGLYETLSRYKLPFKAANIILSPQNEEYFTCRELSEIFFYYLSQTKDIPKEVMYDNFKIVNSPDEHIGGKDGFYMDTEVYFDGVTKKYLSGYGQPFYCGFGSKLDKNRTTVISLEYNFYSEGDPRSASTWPEAGDYMDIEITSKFSNLWLEVDIKLRTLDQALEWYLNEYPKIIIDFTKDVLDEIDEYIEESEYLKHN